MKEDPSPWRRRALVILLATVFLAPVGVAWWLHSGIHWRPAETINHGVLIVPPRRLDTNYQLLTPGGTRLRSNYLRGKWTLVTIGGSSCDTICNKTFYKMRQASVAQGENRLRVQRLFMLVSERNVPPGSVAEYPGMDVAALARAGRGTFLAPFSIDGAEPLEVGRVYLVDPLGNLMMYYYSDAQPMGILKDLRRLLKFSSIG